MAIPNKPLVLHGEAGKDAPFEFQELGAFDEALLFEQGGFSRRAVRDFLLAHSNWTAKDLSLIKEKELLDLWKQVVDKVNEATVPLVK